MVVEMGDWSPSAVLTELERLLASPADFGEEFERIFLGEGTSLHVYLPQPEIQSAITPPFMEAFLVLQKQLYQFAAFTSVGVADVGQLTDAEKRALQLNVVVTEGSSNLETRLKEPLEALLKKMVGKLTGKQSAVVIVAVAALLTGYWAFGAWLNQTKEVKLEELKSKDHIAALQALEFSNKEQADAFRKVIDILEQQGAVGNRIYPRSVNDAGRSTIGLLEELGEMAEAIRVYDAHPQYFLGEAADAFSYIWAKLQMPSRTLWASQMSILFARPKRNAPFHLNRN